MITGTLGFAVAALAIGAFAFTAHRAYVVLDSNKRNLFSLAFGFLAIDMLLWALCVAMPTTISTINLLFTSDVLLLFATGCMALLLVDSPSVILKLALGLIAAFAVALRAFQYPPTGFVHDGLLYFNLMGGVRTVILGAFALIWLPAMMIVAKQAARDRAFQGLQTSLASCFVGLILMTGIFLSAQRSAVIIALFIVVISLFILMTVINVFVISLHNQLRNTHHASAK